MGVPLVGRLREWLETVPPYRKPRGTAGRTIAEGLKRDERLVLFILADTEQRGLTYPSLANIAKAAGASRRQTIRIVEALRETLKLLKVVKEAGQHQPTIYQVLIPSGVTTTGTPGSSDSAVTPGGSEVTTASVRGDNCVARGDRAWSPKLRTELKKTETRAAAPQNAGALAIARCTCGMPLAKLANGDIRCLTCGNAETVRALCLVK